MDLLFFWGMKLWGIGAFKVLFYVIMIINIIFTIVWILYCFATMVNSDGSLLGDVLAWVNSFMGGDGVNFIKPISSLILLIGYIAIVFMFSIFKYEVETVFWILCILDCVVAIISFIGCLGGQKSFNGILYAIMDIIALINLNSLV